jgi:transcriptional regulator with XRE-family HTH domain
LVNFFYLFQEERKRLGLSQAEAGALCGVSREMWGKYERGQASPGADVLQAFAAAGADIRYILTGHLVAAQPGRPYGLSPDEAALLDNYRHSSPEAQAALRAMGAALRNRGN